MRPWSSILGTVAASLVLVVVPASAQTTADVAVVDSAFQPSEVTIDAGGTVTWTQTGSLPHTVTADDGSFDSHPDCGPDCMGQGDTFRHTFTEPGTYAYHCRIHGGPGGVGMAGTVVVTAAPTPTPEEEPAPEDGPAPTPTASGPAAEPTSTATEAPAAAPTDAPGDTADDQQEGADEAAVADAPDAADRLPETGAPTSALLVLALLAVAGGAVATRRPRGARRARITRAR